MLFKENLSKNHRRERESRERKYRTNRTLQHPKPALVHYSGAGGAGRAQSLKGVLHGLTLTLTLGENLFKQVRNGIQWL